MGRHRIKNLGGRPSKYSPEVVAKLEEAFKNDFTIIEACIYAGISDDSYKRWLDTKKGFAEKMNSAQAFLFFAAKRNIAQSIAGKTEKLTGKVLIPASVDDAWKLLKSRQKDIYSERVESTGPNGKPIETKSTLEIQKELLDKTLDIWRLKQQNKKS